MRIPYVFAALATTAALASFTPPASAGPCGPEGPCPTCPPTIVVGDSIKDVHIEHADC